MVRSHAVHEALTAACHEGCIQKGVQLLSLWHTEDDHAGEWDQLSSPKKGIKPMQ